MDHQNNTYLPNDPYRPATRRDMVFALVLVLCCVLFMDFFAWGGIGIGTSLASIALFVTAAFFLRGKARKITTYGCFCFAAALITAASLSFTDHTLLKLACIGMTMILGAVSLLEAMQLRARPEGTFRSIADVFFILIDRPFSSFSLATYSLLHRRGESGEPVKRKTGSALIGVLIAIPALIIIVPLLMASDAAFSNLLNILALENAGELIGALLFGTIFFLLLFGLLMSMPSQRQQLSSAEENKGAEPMVVISFLGIIALFYVLYLVSQLAYFFNAFSGLLPENFTVAEYARQGFFEMSLICGINLLILLITNLICRKKDGKTPLAVRLLSLFFCIFSLILAVTALSKIGLYVSSFGMTRLRIYTFVFTLFLVIFFLVVIVRIFRKNTPYMKISFIAAVVMLLLLTFGNVDRIVAAYNVNAYQSGRLETIDMDTLEELNSHAVVPYVFELLGDEGTNVSHRAKLILSHHVDELFVLHTSDDEVKITGKEKDWRSWNLPAAQAADLLEEHFEQYYIAGSRYYDFFD